MSTSGGGPAARQAHSLTYDPINGGVILVSGVAADGNTLRGDTWHYRDGWVEALSSLPPRAYQQMVYNSLTGSLLLFSNTEVRRDANKQG